LSLYLILLAFFILLTTISFRDNARVEVAMGSITSTFGAPVPEPTKPETKGTEGKFADAPRAFIVAVRKLFDEILPAVRLPVVAKNGTMRIQVPVLDLFKRGDSQVRRRSLPLLGGIADGLALQNDQWRFEIEIILGSGAALPGGDDISANLEIRRAGNFARYMRSLGAPAHSIRTGIAAGDPEIVQLSFYIRDVSKARLDLRPEGGR
jgi:hypothetical protein